MSRCPDSPMSQVIAWSATARGRRKAMQRMIFAALTAILVCTPHATIAQDRPSQNPPRPQDAQSREAAASKIEKPDIHEFVIANFKTESGVTLPQAKVVYGTYGHLNAARDN